MRVHHYYHQPHHGPFVPLPAGHGLVGTAMALMVLCTVVWPIQLVWQLCFVLPFQFAKWAWKQWTFHQMLRSGVLIPREGPRE